MWRERGEFILESHAQNTDFVKPLFSRPQFQSKNSCLISSLFGQEIKIFYDRIKVVATVFAFRQNNPLGAISLILPQPP